MILALVFFC